MQATIQKIKDELKDFYSSEEIRGITRVLFSHLLNISVAEMILHSDLILDNEIKSKINDYILRLRRYEPIQYITGETEFYNLKIKVNPAVLIPRPETEELVDWILQSEQSGYSTILDIGTGSGCIALALKNNLPGTRVFAADISEKAIVTASENAKILDLDIDFLQFDVLSQQPVDQLFDLIVSNPPYVRFSEQKLMQQNVVCYEPHEALFVSDEDPLVFYRSIARFAETILMEGGWLYFEINEAFGSEMTGMLRDSGFIGIEIRKDLSGKERMIRCRKNQAQGK